MSLDKAAIGRIATERGWDHDAILKRYEHGIDWTMTRAVLRSLTTRPTARRALQVVQAGGFWSDERRWICQLKGDPSCETCQEAVGDDEHYFRVQCPAVQINMMWRKIAGEAHATPSTYARPELAPLNYLGLPPRPRPWKPAADAPPEGWLSMEPGGTTYGDGSGFHQQVREARIATWSVIRLRESPTGQMTRAEALRGTVAGLFPTVPRAEMTALLQHLRHAGPGAVYGGDCQHVLETAKSGVPPYYTSSKCANADLWRAIRTALHDHGTPMAMKKIKAHATRSAAVASGTLAEDWLGNHLADQHCKSLAKNMAAAQEEAGEGPEEKRTYRTTINHVTAVAAWAFRHRPQYAKGGRKSRPRRTNDSEGTHSVVTVSNGKWRCEHCRREAWSQRALARLRRTDCSGHIISACHPSHALTTTSGILWCKRCGAYTTRQPRSLRFSCTGRPQSEAAFNVRARLLRGLPPTTASYLDGASVANPGPYLEIARRPTDKLKSNMTEDGAYEHGAGDSNTRQKHTRPHANVAAETDGNGSSFDAQQRPPATARRRIRGKSTPPGIGMYTADPMTTTTAMNTVERREHDISERTARSRYRQLDLRTAATEKGPDGRHVSATTRVVQSPRAARVATRCPSHHCAPSAEAHWIHRLTIVRSSAAIGCAICHAKCRARCAGCGAPCCVKCARNKLPCTVASTRDDALATQHHHPVGLGEEDGHHHSRHHGLTGAAMQRADSATSSCAADRSLTIYHRLPVDLGEGGGHHLSHHHDTTRAAVQRADPTTNPFEDIGVGQSAGTQGETHHPPHMRGHTDTADLCAVASAVPASCSVSTSSQVAAAVVDACGDMPCHGAP